MLATMLVAIRRGAAIAAVAVPVLLAASEAPSPTLLNQRTILGLMGLWVVVIGMRSGGTSAREISGFAWCRNGGLCLSRWISRSGLATVNRRWHCGCDSGIRGAGLCRKRGRPR
jgi:hypothetical protein